MLEKFAKTLERHFDGILAYFDFDSLSTGPLEGTNNKIKTMQRKAYGFRDMDFFKLKIMALHVSALNGENLKHLKICKAKERFVEELKKSGIGYCVVRPHGFFSDISEFYHMAKKGRIYLFGNVQWCAPDVY